MMDRRKVYFHPGQMEMMAVSANIEVLIAPRGWGKSAGVDAPRIVRNVFAMPGSVGAILSPTYLKLLTNTLPPVFATFKRLGYYRDVHYTVGRKAPKKMGFAMPHTEPEDWSHTIHFFNGSIIQMLSFDRNMSANSMSIDYFIGFEARFLDRQKIKEEVMPANRGNLSLFSGCPWHHSYLLTTDMPTTQQGSWLFEYEARMNSQLIDVIKHTYLEVQDVKLELSQKPNSEHFKRKLKQLQKEMSIMRSNAVFYKEADPFENLDLLGEKFFRDMKRDLPPLIFQTSVLNRRAKKIENGFYSSLNEKIHVYVQNDNLYLDNIEYKVDKFNNNDCRRDGDIDKEQPLCIALDYNAAINSLVCGQTDGRGMRTLSSFFVKTPQKIDDLVIAFCKYYSHLPLHEVVYYYDHTAVWKTPLDNISLAEAVMQSFERMGWYVHGVHIGQAIRHNLKYLYINKALRGDNDFLFPTFNRDNNEYLLLAMNLTGVRQGRNGFEKDKSLEHKPDTADHPDEKKTHITDAWDTLFMGLNKHPYSGSYSGGGCYINQ